jgi:hypothetical protein
MPIIAYPNAPQIDAAKTLAVHASSVTYKTTDISLGLDGEVDYRVHASIDIPSYVKTLLDSLGESDEVVSVTVEWHHTSKNGNASQPKITFHTGL